MPAIATTAYNTARTCTTLIRSLLNDAGVNAAVIGIASVTRIGNLVTVTTVGPHPFAAADQATITVPLDPTYNGTLPVVAVLSTTQFTYNNNGANSGPILGGTAVGVNTGAVWTDGVLLPYLNSSYRHIQRALAMTGSTTFITDNTQIVVSAVPVDASAQVTVNDNTAPPNNLPYDLLYPLRLWERANLSQDQFIEMIDLTAHGGLPSRQQGPFLSFWEWQADGLRFLGATQDIQVRMRYAKALPDLTDGNSVILIRNAVDAVAYEAAAMAGQSRGSPLADKWDAAATDAIEALVAAGTRKQQYGNFRRRPFSARGGYPGRNLWG